MKFNVITLFPEMVKNALSYGVIGKAFEQNLVSLNCINPRDFAENKHNRVDDKPFGGGPGMVMMYDPMSRAVESLKQQGCVGKVVFLSPHGKQLDQSKCNELAANADVASSLTLVCGRYEGIDQRFVDEYVDEEISIGDYVLTGGELAAQVMMDATVRLLPSILGNEASTEEESFLSQYF